MKFLLAFLLLSAAAHAQIVTYKGGLMSTHGPVPIGGDYVMDVNLANNTFVATTSVDCTPIEAFTGSYDAKGKLTGHSMTFGYPISGKFKLKNGYLTFTGRVDAGTFKYKIQCAVGVFP